MVLLLLHILFCKRIWMHVKYHPSLDHIYIVDFVSTAAMMIYNVKKLNKEGVLLNDFFFSKWRFLETLNLLVFSNETPLYVITVWAWSFGAIKDLCICMSRDNNNNYSRARPDMGGGGGLRGDPAVPLPLPAPSPPLFPRVVQGGSAPTGGVALRGGGLPGSSTNLLNFLGCLCKTWTHLVVPWLDAKRIISAEPFRSSESWANNKPALVYLISLWCNM